ncbi:hypothetical protein [Amycolatopsis sp.]|jgi:hypothetical protein|uniref:hypothetical protein n=1 Tax=Amycolatopsis sp. TaxID=37632 RepID=UPI002DFC59FD|nr:hypothetical protein [Amycolatopsis sp.]
MFATVLTWIGTVLGLGVLVATAIGAVALDFDDAFRGRRKKAAPEVPESAPLT